MRGLTEEREIGGYVNIKYGFETQNLGNVLIQQKITIMKSPGINPESFLSTLKIKN